MRASVFLVVSLLAVAASLPGAVQDQAADRSPHLHVVAALRSEYEGEEDRVVAGQPEVVTYLTAEEREPFAVRVEPDGRLYRADGTELHTGLGLSQMFVMDRQGRLYVAPAGHWNGRYLKHSSLLAGAPVAGAGMIQAVEGRIRLLTRESGHYRPPKCLLQQVRDELQRQGADLTQAVFLDGI